MLTIAGILVSLAGLGWGIWKMVSRASAEQQGEVNQRNNDMAANIGALEREKQADVNAPMDKDDVEKRLRDGTA